MKRVLALVQPRKLDAVTQAQEGAGDFHAMSVSCCAGFGRERSEETAAGRDTERSEAARTGRCGDGIVFVLPAERALRAMNLREGEVER